MGCNTGKINPTNDSATRHNNSDNYNGDDRAKDNSIFSQKNMAADDVTVSKVPNVNEHLDIQMVDPQAFSNSIVQQREQVINNSSYRSNIESWQPKSLQQLAEMVKSLAKGKPSLDRYWIIYYWIISNIEYDTKTYFGDKIGDQTAEGVFRNRKGMCAGYANLYKYLCDQLQMPCAIVGGFSKGYGFEYRKNPPLRTDHAWNAVEVDHRWYLVEPTWGSGHLNETDIFQRKVDFHYFLPRPNELIYHHFPEEQKWQLIRTPIKLEQFMQLPHLRPLYFDYQVDLVHPRNQVYLSLLPGRSYALVFIRAAPDVYLMADLKLKDQVIEGSHHVMYDKRKQLYRCYFAPSSTGKHKITIFGKKGDSDIGEYQSILEFILDITQLPKNIISFPRTWKKFFDYDIEVVSPQNTHLIKLNRSSHAQICIKAPENIEFLGRLTDKNGEEVADGDHVFYDRQSRTWQCEFAPNREGLYEALLMAKKKSDPGKFTSAVAFKIDAKQISAAPVSYPETWPLFYDFSLNIEAPKKSANAVWADNASYAEVLMQAPKDIQLSCSIQHNNIKVENGSLAQYDNAKKLWQLLFAPEQTGPHDLFVYARRVNSNNDSSEAVVKFNLNVTKLRQPIKFPMTYTEFQTRKCQLYNPMNGIVKKGSVITIHCMVPGAIDVTVAVDSQVQPSGGYSNSVFNRQVTVGSRDILVCAKYNQKSDYAGLVQYTVR